MASFPNLREAAREARRGKRFRDYALAFHFDEEGEILRLGEELLSRAYRPGPYRSFTIVDPSSGSSARRRTATVWCITRSYG